MIGLFTGHRHYRHCRENQSVLLANVCSLLQYLIMPLSFVSGRGSVHNRMLEETNFYCPLGSDGLYCFRWRFFLCTQRSATPSLMKFCTNLDNF